MDTKGLFWIVWGLVPYTIVPLVPEMHYLKEAHLPTQMMSKIIQRETHRQSPPPGHVNYAGFRPPPPPPRTARQFDDVPLNVVFGEPEQGSQARFPLPALCWFGVPASVCRKSVFGRPNCENAGKTVFLRQTLGSKGEMQGSARK